MTNTSFFSRLMFVIGSQSQQYELLLHARANQHPIEPHQGLPSSCIFSMRVDHDWHRNHLRRRTLG